MHSVLLPSYPADLLTVHSCLKGPCTSCSPPLPACGGPDLQAGGVFAAPRPGSLSWWWPRLQGPWKWMERCCGRQCSAVSCEGKASGWRSCLCGRLSLDTGIPLPHCRKQRVEAIRRSLTKVYAKHFHMQYTEYCCIQAVIQSSDAEKLNRLTCKF